MNVLFLIAAGLTTILCFPMDNAPDFGLNDANNWPAPEGHDLQHLENGDADDKEEEVHALAADVHLEPSEDQQEPDDEAENQVNDKSSSLVLEHNGQQNNNVAADWSDDEDLNNAVPAEHVDTQHYDALYDVEQVAGDQHEQHAEAPQGINDQHNGQDFEQQPDE